jgi:hypothetical protein
LGRRSGAQADLGLAASHSRRRGQAFFFDTLVIRAETAIGKETRMTFDTPLILKGPLREPQMLADQAHGGHGSIHHDAGYAQAPPVEV